MLVLAPFVVYILQLGWAGVLVSTEQLKDMRCIIVYIHSGGTKSPETLSS